MRTGTWDWEGKICQVCQQVGASCLISNSPLFRNRGGWWHLSLSETDVMPNEQNYSLIFIIIFNFREPDKLYEMHSSGDINDCMPAS